MANKWKDLDDKIFYWCYSITLSASVKLPQPGQITDQSQLSNARRRSKMVGQSLFAPCLVSEATSSSETSDHQTLCHWIVNFLLNNNETLSKTKKSSFSYKEQLYAISFDPYIEFGRGNHFRACGQHGTTHRSLWVVKKTSSRRVQVQHFAVLAEERFPFHSDRRNKWFKRDNVVIANVVRTRKSELPPGIPCWESSNLMTKN